MSRKADNFSQAWGLELGGSAVRLVRVTRTNGAYRADRYVEVALEQRWESAPSLTAALEKLSGQVTPTGPLAVALPDEWVLHRVLVLPTAPPAALGAIVANQVELLLPAQAASFRWSWSHGPDPFQGGKERVLLCAARKDVLDVLGHCLPTFGQAPAAALPSGVALAAAWPLLHGPNGSLLLLDVAARSTSLVVLHQGRPIRCAVVDEGGDHWTHRLAASEHLAPAQAESAKVDCSTDGALPPALASHVVERLSQETARWAGQLREAYNDCVADIPRPQRPGQCVLIGRAALTRGLVSLVGNTLGVTASLAALPPKLSADSRVAFDQAPGAISAAVAVMQETPPAINLAAVLAAKRPLWHRSAWRWGAVAAWLLATIVLLYGLDLNHAARLRADVADVQAKIGGEGQWDLTKAVAQHLEMGAPPPLDVLAEISAIAPAQVQLTAWRYSRKGAISLTGTVPTDQDHQDFLKKLAESALVTRVDPGPVKREQNRLTFEITITASSIRRPVASQPASRPTSQPTTAAGGEERRSRRGGRSFRDLSPEDRERFRGLRGRPSEAETPTAPAEAPSPEVSPAAPESAGPPPAPLEESMEPPPTEGPGPDEQTGSEEPTSQPETQES